MKKILIKSGLIIALGIGSAKYIDIMKPIWNNQMALLQLNNDGSSYAMYQFYNKLIGYAPALIFAVVILSIGLMINQENKGKEKRKDKNE